MNLDGLKLNGTYQIFVYADYFNILGRSVYTIMKNTEAFVVPSKEIGLEVNADAAKNTVISRNQNVGQSHRTNLIIFPVDMWKSSNIWKQTVTNQNSIEEEIKSRLKSGNACCHSVHNLLSSRLLSKNLKIKIYRTIILSCFVWM